MGAMLTIPFAIFGFALGMGIGWILPPQILPLMRSRVPLTTAEALPQDSRSRRDTAISS